MPYTKRDKAPLLAGPATKHISAAAASQQKRKSRLYAPLRMTDITAPRKTLVVVNVRTRFSCGLISPSGSIRAAALHSPRHGPSLGLGKAFERHRGDAHHISVQVIRAAHKDTRTHAHTQTLRYNTTRIPFHTITGDHIK